jgi:hypothetical protein
MAERSIDNSRLLQQNRREADIDPLFDQLVGLSSA